VSVGWSFDLVVPQGSITRERIEWVFAQGAGLGLLPAGPRKRGVLCIDGQGKAHYPDDAAAAIEWLTGHDGLVSLEDESGVSVSLSVARVGNGAWFADFVPDRPLLDRWAIGIDGVNFEGAEREATWRRLDSWLSAISTPLGVLYGYALDEEAQSLVMRHLCVDTRLAAGQIPPFLGWSTELPESSPLTQPLAQVAEAVKRPLVRANSRAVLRLTDWPWLCSAELVREASAALRYTLNDPGCEAPRRRPTS
jgi:hypothetical protein